MAATGPPDAAALEALPADAWATVLVHARTVLDDLAAGEAGPAAQRLRSVPTSRLAGGRGRARLCAVLAEGGPVWQQVRARLAAEPDLPIELAALIAPGEETDDLAGAEQTHDAAKRLRSRLREARADRDRWRRRAEGAEARTGGLEAEIEALRATLAEVEAARGALEEQVTATVEDRQKAVERERRRRDAELEDLRRELTHLRREAEERRKVERQRDTVSTGRRPPAGAPGRRSERRTRHDETSRVIPGRPTRLPEGVRTDTAAGVTLLLEPGRLVLVDGYNVTLKHKGHLELERQRAWLVQLLATLAARRRVQPVVVFDGDRHPVPGTAPRVRDVDVRFTAPGITADDEIVLAVEGTDAPVVVVTDDRELQERVRSARADVIGTGPFLWAAGAGSP